MMRAGGVIALAFALAGAAMATPVDSNSVIKDDVEYYFQTDKSLYELGENVEMLLRVTNVGLTDITFHFQDVMQYYFTVKQNDTLIWHEPKAGAPSGSEFTLQPDQYKEYSITWDMLDDDGGLVSPGLYGVTGSLHPVLLDEGDEYRYVPVSVQVEIIPEPSTLCLLLAGFVGLLAKLKAF